MPKPGLDLTSNHALQSMTEWLRKKAGEDALVCVLIRVEDLSIAAHPALAPREVEELLADRAPELHERLQQNRKAALELAGRKEARAQKAATR